MAALTAPTTEGNDGVPLRFPRPVMALIATGIAAVSIGLPALPASADQVRQSEYWLRTLGITSAWTASKGSGVTVAVLSDGVSPRQPDLAGAVMTAPAPAGAPTAAGGYFGEQGTAIASLIAGHGHGTASNSGIIGVAPQARILSVPVTLPADDPQLSRAAVATAIPGGIAAGIRYAVHHGATVIDLPLDPGQPGVTGTGGAAAAAGGSPAERSAVAFALHHDVVLVAPAGDDGAAADASNYPAAYHGVIAVGAFDQVFNRAAWSNHQSYVTVTAAGAAVTAASGSGYQTMSSTSAASAVVSGIAALIRARYPQLTVADVRKALTSSTLYRRPGGLADGSGYGAVDAGKALAAAGQLATLVANRSGAGASAARQSGAGALPWQLPSGSLAGSGSESVGAQILHAGEISAAVLALLLALIAGYAAVGRRRRGTVPAAAPEWTHRPAQSRYPMSSSSDPDPTAGSFATPMARPDRVSGQPQRTPRPDTGLFAPAAGRQAAGGPVRPRLTSAASGPGPIGGAGLNRTASAGPSELAGPAGRASAAGLASTSGLSGPAGFTDPSVSGTPPWDPASPPSADLPWTVAPRRWPGSARPAPAPAASAEQPWPAAPADQPFGTPRPTLPSQLVQPAWTPARGRPAQPGPLPSPDLVPPRTAGSGLPVRQPGANVPRPLSPSGSLWEPVETRPADQGNDSQDSGSRPIYVWNPEPGASE